MGGYLKKKKKEKKEKRCLSLLCRSSVHSEVEELLKLTPERKKPKIQSSAH